MMTPVAHGDEGWFSAHKVGSEVLVDFIDGDIDRPVVMGALYNGREKQPYKQPDDVAKSSWKVKSIPGGKGFNEFTFDNTSGKENVILHAQKDRTETILHNHVETIKANQTTSVGANQTISVGADQTVSVGANRTLSVGKNETTKVKGKREEHVDTAEEVTIKAGRTHTIATGDESLTVSDGSRTVSVKNDDKFKSKTKADEIETTYDINAGTSITIHHKDDATLQLKEGEATLGTKTKVVISNPSGTVTLADNKVTIAAKDELVLGCGAAKISLKKDGTVSISGSAKVALACNNSTVSLEPAQAVVNGAAVNVTASGMMEISGALIKLN
jgi:uncharacterized protein involved in type VI secretion and phage assembly